MKNFVLSLIAGLALMVAPSFAQNITFTTSTPVQCGISMNCHNVPIDSPEGTMQFVAAPYHQVVITFDSVSYIANNSNYFSYTVDNHGHQTNNFFPYISDWTVVYQGVDSFGNRFQATAQLHVYNVYSRGGGGKGGGGAGWRKTLLTSSTTISYMNL